MDIITEKIDITKFIKLLVQVPVRGRRLENSYNMDGK